MWIETNLFLVILLCKHKFYFFCFFPPYLKVYLIFEQFISRMDKRKSHHLSIQTEIKLIFSSHFMLEYYGKFFLRNVGQKKSLCTFHAKPNICRTLCTMHSLAGRFKIAFVLAVCETFWCSSFFFHHFSDGLFVNTFSVRVKTIWR